LGQDSAAVALPALGQGQPDNNPALHDAGHELARKLKQRRAERAARWAESSFSQDSFFATDSRFDTPGSPRPGQGPLEDDDLPANLRA
jgi:hypothetical protein